LQKQFENGLKIENLPSLLEQIFCF
jgi:hypothetical protein